jgi:hypothetical protein
MLILDYRICPESLSVEFGYTLYIFSITLFYLLKKLQTNKILSLVVSGFYEFRKIYCHKNLGGSIKT